MENMRTQSCRDGMNNIRVSCRKPNGMQELRGYSTSYAKSKSTPPPMLNEDNETKIKKGKVNFGSMENWVFSDPELQRRKRVATYKGYSLEKKVKGSFSKSFRWVKESCIQVVHGWK